MNQSFVNELYNEHLNTPKTPSTVAVSSWLDKLLGLLFPGICDNQIKSKEDVERIFSEVQSELTSILSCNELDDSGDIESKVESFMNAIPEIKLKLQKDVQALFDGDPAAKSHTEVIRSYPGFYAIAAHRIANFLFKINVSLVPRIISEHAHSVTGVDIHPGATIGEYFCIDHGTGVVIGETTIVKDHVKIYQGVTLGALSVSKDSASTKRHPTIEKGVVIYAGATILGGDTVIGENSVIGGSVWVTRSVPKDSKIYYKARVADEDGEIDTITFKS